jgi:2-dehydro-3-deoxyglucarate aldolase/4-hydroxy-2-oxoheptanedioate aldolase
MKENRLQRVLRDGGVPVGHMIMEFGGRGIAKILEAAGIDFVVVDTEHSGFGLERVADLMAWLKATPITPIVRVQDSLYHLIAPALDAGALGIMAPNVETAEQARRVVSAVKYAPAGRRGVGIGTAHTDYVAVDAARYVREANENTTVICQIESPEGVSNAAEIAATDGVDVLWVGHFDLSQAMGIPGQFQDPGFHQALGRVVRAARENHKAAAIQPASWDQLELWLSMGFNMISWKSDIALYRGALQGDVARVRQLARGG